MKDLRLHTPSSDSRLPLAVLNAITPGAGHSQSVAATFDGSPFLWATEMVSTAEFSTQSDGLVIESAATNAFNWRAWSLVRTTEVGSLDALTTDNFPNPVTVITFEGGHGPSA